MKLSRLVWFAGTACLPRIAAAGGLFLPGAGAVSTSRAGAAVASADDGEALALNPAGIAKSTGNTITISAAMLQYAMEFQRRGTYEAVPGEAYPYADQPYAVEQNDASPSLGIGSVQPVPVIAFLTDLGGRVPGVHLGVGLYAPNAYPFRDMCTKVPAGCQKYVFNDDPNQPPPPARYDIMKQEAVVILPSLAVAYRILPGLDVGLRLSAGRAQLKSTTALWGTPNANYEEDIKKDGVFAVDATDSFVPAFGLGVAYRPTPNIELGASYTSEIDVHASGTATAQLGPSAASLSLGAGLPAASVSIVPVDDQVARCAAGGRPDLLKGCIDLALPMTLQLGGRYKFLDASGNLKGDLELDLDWENWGKTCSAAEIDSGSCTNASDYRVVVDAQAALNGAPIATLNTSDVRHNLQDTYGVRLGGSYHIAVGARREHDASSEVIVRGGIGYDTTAARTGWLRSDLDGAARTTIALGAAYRTQRFEISVGAGAALEGTTSNPNAGGGAQPCNPTQAAPSCGSGDRQGPDPINPLLPADGQVESPVAQGDYKSHYLLFMLGVSTWF
jgi:long-subunit fatty acid transport protein